jgi:hypothetical protein
MAWVVSVRVAAMRLVAPGMMVMVAVTNVVVAGRSLVDVSLSVVDADITGEGRSRVRRRRGHEARGCERHGGWSRWSEVAAYSFWLRQTSLALTPSCASVALSHG